MTNELSNDELNRAVALACGWKPWPQKEIPEAWENPKGGMDIPWFATSLDACFGPGGPVEVLDKLHIPWVISRHHCLAHSIHGAGPYYRVDTSSANTRRPRVEGKNLPRALCLAFKAAMEANP